MGTWLNMVADTDVSLDKAQSVGQLAQEWLASRNIIEPSFAPLAPGSETLGNPPGRRAGDIIENGYSTDLHSSYLFYFEAKRQVVSTLQGEFILLCPACASHAEDIYGWQDAIEEWFEQSGLGLYKCPTCEYSDPITAWTFQPEWGFCNLSFTFWDWPPLKKSFINEFSAFLGHKLVHIYDKL